MATNSPTECSICSEDFNEEERCPRSLPCSHSICTECIQNLIERNNKICPFCKRPFNATSARDIGINTVCLEVLKMLKEIQQKASAFQKGLETSHIDWRDEFKKENEEKAKQNISRYKEAKCCVDSVIQTNSEIHNCLLHINHVIEDEIIVKLNQIVTENKKTMRCLEEQSKILKRKGKLMNGKEKTMEEALKRLLGSTETSKAASLFDEVESMNLEAKTWLQNLEGHLVELKKSRQKIKEVARCTEDKIRNIQKKLKNHVEVKDAELISSFPVMIIQDIILHQITAVMLQEKTEPVMELIRLGKVYAFQLLGGRQRHAKISVDEKNRICLHHLHEDGISPDVLLLQHSKVMNLVNPSSRLTFLELSDTNRRILGRMYIRLTTDSRIANQFSILCTGEKGPTYTGTNIHIVSCRGSASEFVWFGDNKLLEGNGSTALMAGAKEEEGVFNRPWLMGTVRGWPTSSGESNAAHFNVYTKTIPGKNLSLCFGMVEKGLSVLTGAIDSYRNVKDIVISDSGIVLHI